MERLYIISRIWSIFWKGRVYEVSSKTRWTFIDAILGTSGGEKEYAAQRGFYSEMHP